MSSCQKSAFIRIWDELMKITHHIHPIEKVAVWMRYTVGLSHKVIRDEVNGWVAFILPHSHLSDNTIKSIIDQLRCWDLSNGNWTRSSDELYYFENKCVSISGTASICWEMCHLVRYFTLMASSVLHVNLFWSHMKKGSTGPLVIMKPMWPNYYYANDVF